MVTEQRDYEARAREYLSDDYRPGAIVAMSLPSEDRTKFYYFEFQRRAKEWALTDQDVWKIENDRYYPR